LKINFNMTFVVGQKWWKFEITEILIRPKPHHHCAKKLQSCGFRIWSGDSNRFYSFQCSTEPVTWGPAASCLAKFKREHHFAAAYSSFISPLGASMCQRHTVVGSHRAVHLSGARGRGKWPPAGAHLTQSRATSRPCTDAPPPPPTSHTARLPAYLAKRAPPYIFRVLLYYYKRRIVTRFNDLKYFILFFIIVV
jgi:hypothetical protein